MRKEKKKQLIYCKIYRYIIIIILQLNAVRTGTGTCLLYTSNPGVAAKLFEALYDAGININMISTSEIKISVLVERRDAEKAVQVIHDKFFAI